MDVLDLLLLGALGFCVIKLIIHFARRSKEQSQPKYTPPPRPKPLTEKQRQAMKLKEHVPEQAERRLYSSTAHRAVSEPTRAIREGWALCTVAFEYEDASGLWTDRTVTVHSVTDDYIKGECHDRGAERTFRLDRVMSDITDTETGEILDVDEWAQQYC